MSGIAFQVGLRLKRAFRKTCRTTDRRCRAPAIVIVLLLNLAPLSAAAAADTATTASPPSYGHWSNYLGDTPAPPSVRIAALARQLEPGPLRRALETCPAPRTATPFAIAHRGAPALFPEHTRQSYLAAARQGAGIIECDVTFTRDGALVCRHSQCDLHRTTNILETPLAGRCRVPFSGATDTQPARVECCASDLSLAEFRSLCGKHDSADNSARTAKGYLLGGSRHSAEQYPGCGTLQTLEDSIDLIEQLGRSHAPELKAADSALPFSQEAYAQRLLDAYQDRDVAPASVFLQSFDPADIDYWLRSSPEFGARAVLLDGRDAAINPQNPSDPGMAGNGPTFAQLHERGLRYLAPPIWYLLRADAGKIVPSDYARQARAAGLSLITWTLERSPPVADMIRNPDGRGYYYQSVLSALRNEADLLRVLHVLAQDVGVSAVFADWPETVSAYANCVLTAAEARSDTRR